MMAIPTKWEIFKEFVGNLIAGILLFGSIMLIAWAAGYGVDKQARIDEQQRDQRAEVVRL